GGRTWSWHRLPQKISAIAFADATTGWALSAQGRLFATHDSGLDWRLLPTPRRFDAVWLSSPTRGLAARDRTVFVTRDGGATWSRTFRARLEGSWAPMLECHGGATWLTILLEIGRAHV